MLSVVIPTLNSEADLPACLARMAGADEIVVVDGGSTDATPEIARAAGARLIQAPKGRGSQLRSGGEAAKGDWLLFVHADTVPGPGWREAVAAHSEVYPERAGCFHFRLAAREWQARIVERGVGARVSLLGLPYGDQGLLVPRRLYEEVGGYRPLPLMEDVDIVRRIGRRRIELLSEEAVTSADRWRRDGWFRRSGRNLICLASWWFGASPERLARRYEAGRRLDLG